MPIPRFAVAIQVGQRALIYKSRKWGCCAEQSDFHAFDGGDRDHLLLPFILGKIILCSLPPKPNP
jgi:hypothetical protein